MKTYEKPTFTVVSLTANSAFCTDCYYDAWGDNMDDAIKDAIDGIDNPFTGEEESGCFDIIDGYCKFISAANTPFIFKS